MIFSGKVKNLNLLVIKGVVFLIPVLPLYISNSMLFPYITGKNFAFRILVEFAAALWLPIILTNKEFRPRNSVISLSILIFTFIVGLADLLGISPYNSFWSNYERMEGYVTILHLVLYFMILKSVLRTRKDWLIFFNIFLVVSVIVSLFGLLITIPADPESLSRYVMEYGPRMHSTIGNPPFLASYLLISVFIGGILIFNTQGKYLKFIYMMVILFNSAVIYLTGSRGAILAGAAGLILSLIFLLEWQDIFMKKRKALMLGILIVMSLAVFALNSVDQIKKDQTISRFSNMFSSLSVHSRLDTWKKSVNAIKERPLLGWGQENFSVIYTVNTIPYVREQIWVDRAHNIIIHWLVNAGILGLLAYIAIFAATFHVIRKARKQKLVNKRETSFIIIALMVYIAQNLFTFDTINTYFIFISLLAYIDVRCTAVEVYTINNDGDGSRKSNTIYINLMMASLLCFSVACYYLNYKPIKQSIKIMKINTAFTEYDSFTDVLNDYRDVLSYNGFGNATVTNKMISLSEQILRMKLFEQNGAKGFIQTTIKEMDTYRALFEHDMAFLTKAIRFIKAIALYDQKFIEKTEELIEEGIRINPDYQWLYMAQADIYQLKKDYEGAFVNVKRVVDFDPRNDKKLLKLIIAAIYVSKEEVVNRAFDVIRDVRMTGKSNFGNEDKSVLSAGELYQITHAYMEVKNYQKALEYLKEIIKVLSYKDEVYLKRDYKFHEPHRKARVHLNIAKIYLFKNENENAAKEIEKARILAPEIVNDEFEGLFIN